MYEQIGGRRPRGFQNLRIDGEVIVAEAFRVAAWGVRLGSAAPTSATTLSANMAELRAGYTHGGVRMPVNV